MFLLEVLFLVFVLFLIKLHLFISYVCPIFLPYMVMVCCQFCYLSFLLKTTESHILLKSFKNPSRVKPGRKLLSPDMHFTIHYLLLLLAHSECCSLCTAVSNIYGPNSLSFSLCLPKPITQERTFIFHT